MGSAIIPYLFKILKPFFTHYISIRFYNANQFSQLDRGNFRMLARQYSFA